MSAVSWTIEQVSPFKVGMTERSPESALAYLRAVVAEPLPEDHPAVCLARESGFVSIESTGMSGVERVVNLSLDAAACRAGSMEAAFLGSRIEAASVSAGTKLVPVGTSDSHPELLAGADGALYGSFDGVVERLGFGLTEALGNIFGPSVGEATPDRERVVLPSKKEIWLNPWIAEIAAREMLRLFRGVSESAYSQIQAMAFVDRPVIDISVLDYRDQQRVLRHLAKEPFPDFAKRLGWESTDLRGRPQQIAQLSQAAGHEIDLD